jgi:hypothetical protein
MLDLVLSNFIMNKLILLYFELDYLNVFLLCY